MTNNMLQYNNYFGSVEFSAEDDCFFGKIIGITDLITFEGDSIQSLKTAFQEAIDDYLLLCKEVGKEPQNTYAAPT
ncbi:MAG: type II toxin-antitoxin system HicB family antitoxin [Oscillospiraceae bacterium]|jgi:predicted HicB family RNase H-like nuclease|nr:type II toxin-antitoxin system HicB family antitoxin [Oscillospiraceae bacterium]